MLSECSSDWKHEGFYWLIRTKKLDGRPFQAELWNAIGSLEIPSVLTSSSHSKDREAPISEAPALLYYKHDGNIYEIHAILLMGVSPSVPHREVRQRIMCRCQKKKITVREYHW